MERCVIHRHGREGENYQNLFQNPPPAFVEEAQKLRINLNLNVYYEGYFFFTNLCFCVCV